MTADLAAIFGSLLRYHIATPDEPLPAASTGITWIWAANGVFKRGVNQHLDALIAPDHPDLGPKNNQFVYLWGRKKGGRSDFAKRFTDAFGTVMVYGNLPPEPVSGVAPAPARLGMIDVGKRRVTSLSFVGTDYLLIGTMDDEPEVEAA